MLKKTLFVLILATLLVFKNVAQDFVVEPITGFKEITVENVDNLEVIFRLRNVSSFSWSPDGRQLALGVGTQVMLYEVPNFEAEPAILEFGEGNNVMGVGFIPQTHSLFVDTSSQPRIVYDSYTLEAVGPLLGGGFSHDGTMFAGIGQDSIRIYRTNNNELIAEYPVEPSEYECEYACGIYDIVWSPDDTQIVFSGHDGIKPGVMDISTGEIVVSLEADRQGFVIGWTGLAYHPDGHIVASLTGTPGYIGDLGTLLTDTTTGEVVGRIRTYGVGIAPSFNRTGNLIAIGAFNPEYRVQDGIAYVLFYDVQRILAAGEVEFEDALYSTHNIGLTYKTAFSPTSQLFATRGTSASGTDSLFLIWGIPID